MYNLIIKDILIQKRQFMFSLVYLVFLLFVLQSMHESMFAVILGAFTYMLVMTACAYDEKNKSDLMLNSLPVKRVYIVGAKYLSVFLYFIIVTIIYGLLVKIVSLLQIPITTYPLSLEVLISGFSVVTLMTGIWLPIYYKMGYMKMRFVNFVMFFIFFFGTSLLVQYAKKEHTNPLIKSIIDFYSAQSHITIELFVMAILILYMFASFGLSLRFYKSKEF